MWLEQDKFREIDKAVCKGESRSLLRVLTEFFHPENQSYRKILDVCPTCQKTLVRKMLPYLEYVVQACPDRHGAWISPEVSEKMKGLMREEITRSSQRGKTIRAISWGVGLFLLLFALSQALSTFSPQRPQPAFERSEAGENLIPIPARIEGIENPLEITYLKEIAALLETAASARIALEDFLSSRHSEEEYWAAFDQYRKDYFRIMGKLHALPVPEALNEFHATLKSALQTQLVFYGEFIHLKNGNKLLRTQDMLNHPALRQSSEELIKAYGLLLKQYPQLDHVTSRAFETRLCDLDIL
jgi:hypothetical protein